MFTSSVSNLSKTDVGDGCVGPKTQKARFVDSGLVNDVRIARVACARAIIGFLVSNRVSTFVFFLDALYGLDWLRVNETMRPHLSS